jgi:lipoate-protein ligase A
VAAASGVSVVRRISGGRPIYSDAGQINYALALGDGSLPQNPAEAFAIVCSGLIASLERLGVAATHHAPNDIEVGGRKISGSALKRGHGALLVHGTLLINTDLELMGRLFRSRGGHRQRTSEQLTDLRREMGRVPAREDLTAALVGGLGQVLDIDFLPSSLLQVEQR